MLKNSKLSIYKIKKILNCYAEDYTSTDASKLLKLNRNTINRYYGVFRNICVALFVKMLPADFDEGAYIGYLKGEKEIQSYFAFYKFDESFFIYKKLNEKPKNIIYAVQDKEFKKFVFFIYARLDKFRGMQEEGYFYHYFESLLRYNFNNEDFFNLILKQLPKISRKEFETNKKIIVDKFGSDLYSECSGKIFSKKRIGRNDKL